MSDSRTAVSLREQARKLVHSIIPYHEECGGGMHYDSCRRCAIEKALIEFAALALKKARQAILQVRNGDTDACGDKCEHMCAEDCCLLVIAALEKGLE